MTTIDEPASQPVADALPSRIIDRVIGMNSDLARQHIARFGGAKSGPELLKRLDRQYRSGITGSGAGVGAAAAAPGVGTAVSLALSGAEAVAALEATMVYVLAYAEVTGIQVEDVERRRTLLLGVLLGQSGQRTIEKVAGRTGPHWAKKVVETVPRETLKKINAVLGRNFVTLYGTKQGIIVLGRIAPFGIGAGIGAAMGAVNSTLVIKATRRAFIKFLPQSPTRPPRPTPRRGLRVRGPTRTVIDPTQVESVEPLRHARKDTPSHDAEPRRSGLRPVGRRRR